jgi:hypothetical protein
MCSDQKRSVVEKVTVDIEANFNFVSLVPNTLPIFNEEEIHTASLHDRLFSFTNTKVVSSKPTLLYTNSYHTVTSDSLKIPRTIIRSKPM